jgi:hypothetical protein
LDESELPDALDGLQDTHASERIGAEASPLLINAIAAFIGADRPIERSTSAVSGSSADGSFPDRYRLQVRSKRDPN